MRSFVDRSHAVLGHTFFFVLLEALRIDDQPAQPVDEKRGAVGQRRQEEAQHVMIAHSEFEGVEHVSIEDELPLHVGGDDRSHVGHMHQDGNRAFEEGADDLKRDRHGYEPPSKGSPLP